MAFRMLAMLALMSAATATAVEKQLGASPIRPLDAVCGIPCANDAQCAASVDCTQCAYGKCAVPTTCPSSCKDSRDCPNGIGRGLCSRCITGPAPGPNPPTPPSPTPTPPPGPPAVCEVCAPGDVCCNPTIMPPQMCPGNIACCDCGAASCKCPTAAADAFVEAFAPATGHCGLGLPCGSPCVLDGDCDQTGSCRSCGGTGQCTNSN